MKTLRILRQNTATRQLEKCKEKLCVSTNEGFFLIPQSEIIYLKSESNYTKIFLQNEKVMMCSKTLKSFMDVLGSDFLRVHQSYMINSRCVTWVESNFNQLALSKEVKIPISRSNKPLVRKWIKEMFQWF